MTRRAWYEIPIFGVGGISNGRDAAEMFMAGASAVQVCTEAILRGPTVYGKIARELNTFLDEHGYASVDEIKGLHCAVDGGARRAHCRLPAPSRIWSAAFCAESAKRVAPTARFIGTRMRKCLRSTKKSVPIAGCV